MKRSNKILFTRYALDLFVIILGISVSFMLNEWREHNQNQRSEIAALQAIHDDLVADSLVIHTENKTIESFQKLYNYFLKNADNPKANPDSIQRALASFAMYTTLEIKNVGYEQLKATGQLGLISDKQLLSQIIDLYTNQYAVVKEYGYIDKKMVLEQYIPFIMKDAPLSINDLNSKPDITKMKAYKTLIKNKTFKNMFFINIGFKAQILTQNRELKNQIKQLINKIEKHLQAYT